MSIISCLPEQTPSPHPLLHHGGRIRAAAAHYGIAVSDWLDLSTGIHPNGWPVPELPASSWARLPEDDDGLDQAAREYYGAEYLLPVAGSQAAIQALPRMRPCSRVSVLDPGYAEHAAAWRSAGHDVAAVAAERVNEAAYRSDVLVLVHPNNPTGARFPVDRLLDWHACLASRGGWLVVDEAYMDVTPGDSLCRHSARPGLIVLRSLGKFFGLAGARVGFVCAHPQLLARLHVALGPWGVNGPARWVATAALTDRDWHIAARQRLIDSGSRLHGLLGRRGLTPNGGCGLFQWVRTRDARLLHDALARQGILTRLFAEPSSLRFGRSQHPASRDTGASLRFGLPGSAADWARLDGALSRLPGPDALEAAP